MPRDETPKRSRFVLLCQQGLALGAVLAIAAPATTIVTLNIVAPTPERSSTDASPRIQGSLVASEPVKPKVTEISMSGSGLQDIRTLSRGMSAGVGPLKHLAAITRPEPVADYATVGVTWKHGVKLSGSGITVSVRTQVDGLWSGWETIPYHDDHGPDAGSEEARHSRPGTDPLAVGDVDDVQVRAVTASGDAPPDMKLALVDPGKAVDPKVEKPAIDTAKLASAETGVAPTSGVDVAASATPTPTPIPAPTTDPPPTVPVSDGGDATLAGTPGAVTPKPKIFSRAQWGADESMRDKSSLHYGEVHAAFVHHTVNANNYTRAQVPAIIRGIYAYHTQSRGWSDVGYNFLVDRFGRIWEGRYGGVDRPVVGAHTLNYNDYATAMSAIGNYDIKRPPAAIVRAFGRLFAWKLSLHGVNAASTRQWVGSRYLQAIDGHRDVGQTACPGKYLYAKIPKIRLLAAEQQMAFTERAKQTNVSGSRWPDLFVRNKTNKEAYVVHTREGGLGTVVDTKTRLPNANLVLNVGDWNGDGFGDVITRSALSGALYLRAGNGKSRFAKPVLADTGFGAVKMITAVGDMTGDGYPDLMGQPRGAAMRIYPGNGASGFKTSYVAHSAITANAQIGVGLWNDDGAPDSLLRRSDGTVMLYPGNGPGGLTNGTAVATGTRKYDWMLGAGDVDGDGKADVMARQASTGQLWLLPGTGAGFGKRRLVGDGFENFDLGG